MHCTCPPSLETIVFHFTKAQLVIILLLSLFVSLAHVSLFSHLHYLLHSPPGSPAYIGGNFFYLPKQERTRKKKGQKGNTFCWNYLSIYTAFSRFINNQEKALNSKKFQCKKETSRLKTSFNMDMVTRN